MLIRVPYASDCKHFLYRQTTCEELFPMDAQREKHSTQKGQDKIAEVGTPEDFFPKSLENDVSLWSPSDVARCLRIFDLEDIAGENYVIGSTMLSTFLDNTSICT